jgi:hypothetical protein
MTEMKAIKLRDVIWGGRVRRNYQAQVWKIAREAATGADSSTHGTMVSSSQSTSLRFLDGGVTDARGYFDSSSGMFVRGELAKAYILYRLGADARALMKNPSLPTLDELTVTITKSKDEKRP